jgi:DNA-binding transcriptional LysR family regulator
MDVQVRDLRYFVAVAEELSFTRAARERLFISQPALSKQIRQLEATLGVTLFDRDRRSVGLTAAGAALLPHARTLIAGWDRAQEELAAIAAAQRARLTVGFQTRFCLELRPAIATAFAERRPDWVLDFRQVSWEDPSAGLLDGRSDVAIVWLPVPETVSWRLLHEEPRWVALPAGHRLAGRDSVAFGDLLDEPFLALPASAGALREYWLAVDERDGRPARVAAEVTTPDETFEAVANGVGVVLLARGNAEIYQPPGVVARPVAGVSPTRLAVAWREQDTRRAVRDFVTVAVANGNPARRGVAA